MERKTGVVIPLSALYTKECPAAGDFLALKNFADFCEKCSLGVIQLLPVNDTGTQSSPYSGLSAYALHPMYIRIKALPEFDEAYKRDKTFAAAYRAFKKECLYTSRFDYDEILNRKTTLLHLLYAFIEKKMSGKLKKTETDTVTPEQYSIQFNTEIDDFVQKNSWIVYYAVFKDLKNSAMQASWKHWSEDLQHMTRQQIELRWKNKAHRSSHNFFVWCQIRAYQQFKEAADYVRSKNITLKGDLPIMMNEDSADCWAWPELFNQETRAGSPPDGENPVGQNWGFPIYSWDKHAANDYAWWKERVKSASQYYDAFRIDHILGFFRIWCVNAGESTAFLGHTNPYSTFSRSQLTELGFDKGRINWLSKPHIPTRIIEDITWNHDEAVRILSAIGERVGSEELWNFKKSIKTDSQIYSEHFCDDGQKDIAVKNALASKWRDRTIIEIADDSFIPVYSYNGTTAWNTLNAEEKEKLEKLFEETKKAELKMWEKQAMETLTPICRTTGMTACAEDLGVNLECMPKVLDNIGILSLKVVRWNREWSKDKQPYIPFKEIPAMSVCTTSVHDSPTLRQWWNNEKSSVEAYIECIKEAGEDVPETISKDNQFDQATASFCLNTSAKANSIWYVNPLQDYLFLEQKYYLPNEDDERINIPGSVTKFNWTYRIPVTVEELAKDKALIKIIKSVASIHDK